MDGVAAALVGRDQAVLRFTRSDPDPIVVNLPELDKFAEPAARKYPHP